MTQIDPGLNRSRVASIASRSRDIVIIRSVDDVGKSNDTAYS